MKLLWIDLETTGLDPKSDKILEIGYAITDEKLNILKSNSFVIKNDNLPRLEPFVYRMHMDNGLLSEVRLSMMDLELIDTEIAEIIDNEFGINYEQAKNVILCNSSVHFDRSFIKAHLPQIEKRLHYRMLDVSSFKIVFEQMFNIKYKSYDIKRHRSISDIMESINELRFYSQFIDLGIAFKKTYPNAGTVDLTIKLDDDYPY